MPQGRWLKSQPGGDSFIGENQIPPIFLAPKVGNPAQTLYFPRQDLKDARPKLAA